MEYYGFWGINHKEIVGKCVISPEKRMLLELDRPTVMDYEEGDVIIGECNEGNALVINPKLNDVSYNKTVYSFDYLLLTEHLKYSFDMNVKYLDFRKIKFKIDSLEEWLGIEKINNMQKLIFEEDVKNIKFIELRTIDDILLMDNDTYKIFISYDKKIDYNLTDSSSLDFISYEAFLNIEYKKKIDLQEIDNDIKMVNRFFSLFIGYGDEIPFYQTFDESEIPEMVKVFSRVSYNYNLINKDGWKQKYFIKYENIKDKIMSLFDSWIKIYGNEQYKLIIDNYFQSSNNSVLEDRYLQICKSIESFYNYDNNIQRESFVNNENSNELYDILICDDSIKSRIYTLLDKLSHNKKSKKEYIKKMSSQMIESLYDIYINRNKIGQIVKKVDEFGIYGEYFDKNDIYSYKNNNEIYDHIGNTRNYYTHLSEKINTFKEERIIKYSNILELILLNVFMKKIGIDIELREYSLKRLNYLLINIKHIEGIE